MDSGFMALSIYCVQMAPKWSCVLDSQPIQGKDTSVQVYYDQFCSWRSKLEAVNYIGDEEWYVDDFLCGLKMDLVVRVLGYKWRPRRLSDAFRRAEIEEIMLSWKENSRKNDADEVFEEMSHPKSVYSAEFQGAEDVSEEKNDDGIDAPSFVATKEGFSNLFDTKAINSVEEDVFGLGDLENEAVQMLENLIEPFQTGNSPLIKAETKLVDQDKQTFPAGNVSVAYQVFDAMTKLFSVKPTEELNGDEDSIPPIDCVPRVFDPGSDTTENVCTNGSSLKEIKGLFTPRSVLSSISFKDVGAVLMLSMPLPSPCMNEQDADYMASMIIRVSSINNDRIFLFDPGGSLCLFRPWVLRSFLYSNHRRRMEYTAIASYSSFLSPWLSGLRSHSTSFGNRAVNDTNRDSKGNKKLDRGHILEVGVTKHILTPNDNTSDFATSHEPYEKAVLCKGNHICQEITQRLYDRFGYVYGFLILLKSEIDSFKCPPNIGGNLNSISEAVSVIVSDPKSIASFTVGTLNFSLLAVKDSLWWLTEGQNVSEIYPIVGRSELISRLYHMLEFCKDEIILAIYMDGDTMDVIIALARKKLAKAVPKEISELQVVASILTQLSAIVQVVSSHWILTTKYGSTLDESWTISNAYKDNLEPALVIEGSSCEFKGNFSVWTPYSSFYVHKERHLSGHI